MKNLLLTNPREGIKKAYINLMPNEDSNWGAVILYVTWNNLIRGEETIYSKKGINQAIVSAKAYYSREYQSKKHGFDKPKWIED